MINPSRKPIVATVLIALGLVFIVTALTVGNLRYARQNPGGNDFLVHWTGTRNLLVEGVSPYSDETAELIQTYAYGRPARAGEHELRFAYPLYSIILFLPFSLLEDFVVARAVWMTLLEISLIALAFLGARLVNWRPSPIVLVLYLIFAVLSYHSLRPVINGNAVIVVAVLITGGLLAMRHKADELAGVLLAFSTIKPQLVVLLIVFVVVWAIKKRRHKVVYWFFGTLILLILSAMLIIPDWIWQNFLEVLAYPEYNPPISLQTALAELFPSFGARVGWAVAGVLALVLLLEWSFAVRGKFTAFLFAAVVTLLASQWIGIPTDPGNFIILFPAIVLILESWERRWETTGTVYNLIFLLVLFVLPWFIFVQTLEPGAQPLQSPIMFFPLPAFLWVLLYWSRWWILQSDERLSSELFEDEDLPML